MKISTLLALATAGTAAAAPGALLALRDEIVPNHNDPRFIRMAMDAHWYWRKIHCAQDLQWDHALAQAAFDSANRCTEKPEHDRSGSNLSAVGPAPHDFDGWMEFARTSMHGWHEEEPKYPYDNPHYDGAWGHFTQMVWRDSSRLGCAVAHCADRDYVPGRVYCFYENAGNNIAGDAFAQNVWRPICPDPTRIRG